MACETSPDPGNTWYGGNRRVRLGMILGSVAVLASVLAIRYYWPAEPAAAEAPGQTSRRNTSQAVRPAQRSSQAQPPARSAQSKLDVVAKVNGEPITREDLAHECLRHYGERVLENYLNSQLISQECQRRGIRVTREEVNAEIERMAKHFGLTVQQYYKMRKEEGIQPAQYASTIKSFLALRRLAADQLEVTEQELRQAYETQYGPAVKARLIACKNPDKAQVIRAEVLARPDDFGRVAKEKSEDTPSASDMGWIPPIRKHGGPKEIEQVAFTMQDGEISPVIRVHDQCVILKREKGIPAQNVPFEQVAPLLNRMVERRKLRLVAHDLFDQLKQRAQVENCFNDPDKRRMGIVALVNGQKITAGQLADVCIERHGEEVLEGTINRKLIEQACKKAKVTITNADLEEEIRRAAEVSVPPKPDGSPDVEAWIKLATERQGISKEVYLHDSVWPSVALRKLVDDQVRVTEDDIDRGFEANYGPRVRCLAIVFGDLRLAHRVWEMAREKYDVLKAAHQKQLASGVPRQRATSVFFDSFGDFFGDLAEQYSIEPGSKKLRGQVPPIRKWGGQPMLEQDAFALAPGELSGITQVGDKYVILFCQGRTTPVKVERQSVRNLIVEDLREKKRRQAMAKYFQHLQDFSTIDNYLAGTSQSPRERLRAAKKSPKLQPVPVRR